MSYYSITIEAIRIQTYYIDSYSRLLVYTSIALLKPYLLSIIDYIEIAIKLE